jgi:hypothetical protein
MQAAVVDVAATHVHDLCAKSGFKDLLREGGDFAVDYLEKLQQMPQQYT